MRWFEFLRRWHRYEVEGFENLETDEPRLIVGYHGRPIAWDLCMLLNVCDERLGYMPHPIFHSYFAENPTLNRFIDDMGFMTGDDERLAAAVARGEHILVTPGGTREGCRSFRERYSVDWGGRTGYLRLALRHGLRIVPVAAHGIDDVFFGLNNGYQLGRRLGAPAGLPVWIGVGLTGVWPFSLPFPVKIRQIVGEAIDPAEGGVDPADRDALLVVHHRVVGAVQALLDRRG